MLKDHPKGLVVLFFSNMGERFGYYTMMAIFTLYFEGSFGLSISNIGIIWGAFLFSIYFIPLFGGMLADKVGYGKIVAAGIVFMFLGYGMMAVPGQTQLFVFASLFVIAIGTGLFKGNLVVILGNLYEEQKFKKMHDAAFNIYYMGINIGAFLSPFAATGIRNFLLKGDGFVYNAKIPGMAHQFLKGTLANVAEYETIARNMVGEAFTGLTDFSNQYIASLGRGYNAGFAIASVSIIISLLIFLGFKKYYKHADYLQKDRLKADKTIVELTPLQTRNRIFALMMVFSVVIFFWMAFHQNGLILTVFAKNYTTGSVGPITKLFFDLPAFISIIAVIMGLIFLLMKRFGGKVKIIGLALAAAGAFVISWRYGIFKGLGDGNPISPELFQSFNPIFVVFLTPVILGIFAFLRSKGKEPASPRKIGIGMFIMGFGWLILITAAVSHNLASPKELLNVGSVSSVLVSPYWLISMYFGMTIAELFISPMGLAYVSKVSPPKLRGTMQGGWLAATAIGNLLSGVMATPYAKLELWQCYAILVVTSFLAGGIMFAMLKKLNKLAAS